MGESWHARCALVQWDNYVWELGVYPEGVREELRERFGFEVSEGGWWWWVLWVQTCGSYGCDY